MPKSKKSLKKTKFNPAALERYILVFLLVAFLISSAVLVVRNQNTNTKAELAEPSAPIEKKE